MPLSSTCTFPNTRGERLSARLERPDQSPTRAAALFAHCFTCSKDLKVERAIVRALTQEGIAVLAFDFAGLGRSGGDFADSTFSSDVDDLIAAAYYLREELQAPSLLVGHSLGGAAVLSAAGRLPEVRAVATIGAPADPAHVAHLLENDLAEIRERGEATVTIAGRSFTVRSTFLEDLQAQDLPSRLAALDAGLLLFHSPQDDTVGIDNARILYEGARHPKSFVVLDGADHLLTNPADAAYVAKVTAAWASRYLPLESGGDQPRQPIAGMPDDAALAANRGGFRTDVNVRTHAFVADEPTGVGGEDAGPTPYELLASALAVCTSMTVRVYAERKGWPLDEVRTAVWHHNVHARDCEDCEQREGRIEAFHRRVELSGDLEREQLDRLLEIANRCPVHRTLQGQIEIRTDRA